MNRVLMFTLCLLCAAGASALALKSYDYYIVGDNRDVSRPTMSALYLQGGGRDVNRGFEWFLRKANGGDVVVLRAAGSSSYNTYLQALAKVDSVETLVINTSEGASDRFVLDRVRNAEALFIEGGSQWDYTARWRNSPLQGAIHHLVWRGVPIGGSAAGLTILGGYYFSAKYGAVTSAEALANPYNSKITLEANFLRIPYMDRVIADSHIFARDRLGRLVTFLARVRKETHKDMRAIGIDEQTAVTVERDGDAHVVGNGAVYFLRLDTDPAVCVPGKPLTVNGIETFRVPSGGSFNVRTWKSEAVSTYELSVENGTLHSSTGSLY